VYEGKKTIFPIGAPAVYKTKEIEDLLFEDSGQIIDNIRSRF